MDNVLKKKMSDRLLWYFGLSELCPKKITSISEEEWQHIERWIDSLLDNFLSRLIRTHPNLTKNDLHICCLLRLKLNRSYIADLMNISISSVSTSKLRIKKKISAQYPDIWVDRKTLDSYLLDIL